MAFGQIICEGYSNRIFVPHDSAKMGAQMLAKLRQLGICPASYRWIKQAGGYRCQAGGHFVTDSQLKWEFSHNILDY